MKEARIDAFKETLQNIVWTRVIGSIADAVQSSNDATNETNLRMNANLNHEVEP